MHEVRRQRRILRIAGEAVARRFGYTWADMLSPRKSKTLAHTRILALAIANELSGASGPETVRVFGRKDHNSAAYAVRKVETLRRATWDFSAQYHAAKKAARSAVREANL
jgi:chromosomal replication initiator protein